MFLQTPWAHLEKLLQMWLSLSYSDFVCVCRRYQVSGLRKVWGRGREDCVGETWLVPQVAFGCVGTAGAGVNLGAALSISFFFFLSLPLPPQHTSVAAPPGVACGSTTGGGDPGGSWEPLTSQGPRSRGSHYRQVTPASRDLGPGVNTRLLT